MRKIAIIFPHQLFENHPALDRCEDFWLSEDELFFKQYAFHKQKLALQRASMKFYADFLRKRGKKVTYFDFSEDFGLVQLFEKAQLENVGAFVFTNPTDYLLSRRLKRYALKFNIVLEEMETPMFLTTEAETKKLLGDGKSYLMASFYTKQRKRLNLLMDNGKPVGNKWSFDAENRKKLPGDHVCPKPIVFAENSYVAEAKSYVLSKFPNNPGQLELFNYPVTFDEANLAFDDFLEKRLSLFGDYEDAFSNTQPFLYHSLLTPYLNIGLITPQVVLDKLMDFVHHNPVSLNSLEGFIRQIIGWREFMRAVYLKEGVTQRTANYYNYTTSIPKTFYDATTGIVPMDMLIEKVLKYAYNHHIERLMVAGNFMMLCRFNPDAVYRWFMELYIDAYDWVMVPNVYGMTQYADGGLITTKPYISGSNYLNKMGSFPKGEWNQIWDSLYWYQLMENKDRYQNNMRMKLVIALLDKMEASKKVQYQNKAVSYLNSLI